MNARRLGLAVAVVVAAGLVVWRCARADDPATTTSLSGDTPVDGGVAAHAPAAPALGAPSATATAARRAQVPAPPFDTSAQHTADPCTTPLEPKVPAGYETLTVDNITIAWNADATPTGPYDTALRPIALAHLAAGILEEAAQQTGTARRGELTIIVDPSKLDFVNRTKMPIWVAGFYDGGEIVLYARATEDLGTSLSTLRHEIMHAQLHVAIGCIPFWLNEGLAQYFAGPPPIREWLAMLRTGEPFEIAVLGDPAVRDLAAPTATRMYAVSIAMILTIAERGGEPPLRALLRVAAGIDSSRAAAELWERVMPKSGYGTVLDALARKLFNMTTGPELDLVLRGAVCCSGMRLPAEIACRGVPARPEESTSWTDLTVTPRMTCRNKW